MKKFFVADAHCDTIGEMYNPLNLSESKGHFDLARLSEYMGWLQIFAAWADPENDTDYIRKRFDEVCEKVSFQKKENKDLICFVKNKKELESSVKKYKCTGILAIEGGEIIGDDANYLDYLYKKGVRVITLTWNYDNSIGCGCSCSEDKGLGEFGRLVLGKMNEMGIIADVSHASEKTFWDVCEVSKRAVMASHSNARKLCNHKRNLTDEQIKQLILMNGFVGINYYPKFLSESKEAYVFDIIRHIEYFLALGGENILGLGSDFDGIDYPPGDLVGVQEVYKIADCLLKLNYKEETVEKIMGKNLYNFLERELN